MSGDTPNQYQAEHQLAEAAERSAVICRTDRPLAAALTALAGLYVLVGVAGAFGPGPASGFAVVAVLAIGLAIVVIVLLRRRASSRVGSRIYTNGIVIFSLWNAAVVAGSIWLGWWGPQTPGWHFTVSAAVAAMPLFIAAGVLLRRSR